MDILELFLIIILLYPKYNFRVSRFLGSHILSLTVWCPFLINMATLAQSVAKFSGVLLQKSQLKQKTERFVHWIVKNLPIFRFFHDLDSSFNAK